jgi:hypothetical protein
MCPGRINSVLLHIHSPMRACLKGIHGSIHMEMEAHNVFPCFGAISAHVTESNIYPGIEFGILPV